MQVKLPLMFVFNRYFYIFTHQRLVSQNTLESYLFPWTLTEELYQCDNAISFMLTSGADPNDEVFVQKEITNRMDIVDLICLILRRYNLQPPSHPSYFVIFVGN